MNDAVKHLKFFGELGVDGISRDPAWRERKDDVRPDTFPSAESPAPSTDPPSTSSLSDVREEIGPTCTRCKLGGLGRKQTVFGVGNPNADLMFIGEAPG